MSSDMDRRQFLGLGGIATVSAFGGMVLPKQGPWVTPGDLVRVAARGKPGGVLSMAEADDPGTLDFLHSTLDILRHSIRSAVLDTLFHVGPDLKVTPGVAESWALSSDAKTLTVTLRSNLKFHNGTPCTSADVQYTVSWLKDPHNASPLAVMVANVEEVRQVSPTVAHLHLSSPMPGIIANLTQVPIFSEATVETMKSHPIGLGPFRFAGYHSGQSITVTRNPDYYVPGLPLLDGITWPFITNIQSSLEDLISGNVLMVDDLAVQYVNQVQRGSNTKIVKSAPVNLYEVFQINTKRKPFDDKRVRQALSYAMNRHAYVGAFWYGQAEATDTPFVSEMPSYLPGSAMQYSYDIAKTESLLKSAGFSRSHPLTVEILTPAGFSTLQAMALTLQSTLKAIGHDATVTTLAEAPWIDRIATHPNFDITTDNYNTVPVDPSGIMNSDNYNPSDNINQFDLPDYAHLVAAAASEANPETRNALYQKIQRYLLDQQPCIIVDHYPVLIGASKKVGGLEISPIGTYDYSRATVQ